MGLGVMVDWRRKHAPAVSAAAELAATMEGNNAPNWAGAARYMPRLAVTAALSVLFLWLLSNRLAEVDLGATAQAIAQVSLFSWVVAAGFTVIAFWAVGQYDVLLHRHLGSHVGAPRARIAGISAIAISQVLGLGIVTGSVLRWRMLPDQSLWLVSRITLAVALSFLAGWAVVTALALLFFGTETLALPPYRGAALAVLAVVGFGIVLCVLRPIPGVKWPNLFTILGLIGLCAIDTAAAASALFVMLPPEVPLSLLGFLPAFLLAYGAGLISGTPGGIGAFELALLALLPAQSSGPILAAVIAWRLVYFVLPAMVGAGIAIRGPRASVLPMPPKSYSNLSHWAAQEGAAHEEKIPAEIGLMAQRKHHFLCQSNILDFPIAQMFSARGHVLIASLDPICRPQKRALTTALMLAAQRAKAAGLWPALYKVGPRMASVARSKGWRCLPIAREAVIPCASYDLAAPLRANLRRKLRRADASGVQIRHILPQELPLDALAAINADWSQRHGGERGFSMGQFDPDYIAQQRVYAAHTQEGMTAYITLHCGAGLQRRADEWTLDLMRHGPRLADGTMHALLHRAIMDAKALGIAQVSLAAAPDWAFECRPLGNMGRVMQRAGLDAGHGLRRFKETFAPHWQNRYLCAPHGPAWALAALSIWRAVAFGQSPARTP